MNLENRVRLARAVALDEAALASLLEEWQNIDFNEGVRQGGYTHRIYNNYGSGRSDR